MVCIVFFFLLSELLCFSGAQTCSDGSEGNLSRLERGCQGPGDDLLRITACQCLNIQSPALRACKITTSCCCTYSTYYVNIQSPAFCCTYSTYYVNIQSPALRAYKIATSCWCAYSTYCVIISAINTSKGMDAKMRPL
jgi:hypothetical protein